MNIPAPGQETAAARRPEEEAPPLTRRLRRFGLFAHLPARAMADIVAAIRVLECPPGTWLWRRGDPSLQVLFIERGLASTSRRAREEVDRTYGLYGPGDSMGLHAVWAGMRYPTDAQVLNNPLTALCLETPALVRCAPRRRVDLVGALGLGRRSAHDDGARAVRRDLAAGRAGAGGRHHQPETGHRPTAHLPTSRLPSLAHI